MKIKTFKKIGIELTDEEIQVLKEAKEIVSKLNKNMILSECNYALCNSYYDVDNGYDLDELMKLESQLEALQTITEIV